MTNDCSHSVSRCQSTVKDAYAHPIMIIRSSPGPELYSTMSMNAVGIANRRSLGTGGSGVPPAAAVAAFSRAR